MMLGYRSDDAVVTICQNNRAKSIEISDINNVAEEMLGYKNGDLAKKPLQSILPDRIAEMLGEYVEFETDANDVGAVLAKVQSFAIIGKDGKETGYRLKVVRAESGRESINFKLVLQDRMGLRKNEALRRAIQENFKGHEVLDPDTSLPDKYSLGKDIELMGYYNSKGDLRSCFAIMQLDHFEDLFSQYGRNTAIALMRHIAMVCRQNLRPDDVVGIVEAKRLGVLLLDTTLESARMVFNRLRWQIAANPFELPDKTTLGLSVSIVFARIGGVIADRDIMDDCAAMMDSLGADVTNALAEMDEGEKRKASNSPV